MSAIFGDSATIIATCFAYYADESSTSSRTFNIAIGEALMGVGFAIAAVISGPMIQGLVSVKETYFILSFLQFSMKIIIRIHNHHGPLFRPVSPNDLACRLLLLLQMG